jgi:hypothetical protein
MKKFLMSPEQMTITELMTEYSECVRRSLTVAYDRWECADRAVQLRVEAKRRDVSLLADRIAKSVSYPGHTTSRVVKELTQLAKNDLHIVHAALNYCVKRLANGHPTFQMVRDEVKLRMIAKKELAKREG